MNFDFILDGLSVAAIAAMPVVELRGSIPYGVLVLGLGLIPSFAWSIFGNMLPIPFLLKFLDPIIKWIFEHSKFLERKLSAHFSKLHTKHNASFNKWGALALAIFVAVPIPGTGAWTGALLAYLFNIPFRLALPSILAGVLSAGIIVAVFSESLLGISRMM